MEYLNLAILVSGIFAGFFAGKLHERISWNELVRIGALPKPRKERQ